MILANPKIIKRLEINMHLCSKDLEVCIILVLCLNYSCNNVSETMKFSAVGVL